MALASLCIGMTLLASVYGQGIYKGRKHIQQTGTHLTDRLAIISLNSRR